MSSGDNVRTIVRQGQVAAMLALGWSDGTGPIWISPYAPDKQCAHYLKLPNSRASVLASGVIRWNGRLASNWVPMRFGWKPCLRQGMTTLAPSWNGG